MSTALAADARRAARPGELQSADPVAPALRMVLTCYARTVLVPVAACAVLLLTCTLTGADGRQAAIASAAGWAVLVGAWLYRCGWGAAAIAVTWAGPPAVLAAPVAAGWLSAEGLLLWGPVTSLFAIALTSGHRPMAADRNRTNRNGAEQRRRPRA